MEQAFVDGIILVHGGGRVVFIRLVQGHKEYVQLLFRQPFHALADSGGLQKVQRHQQLVTGISTVQIQRAIKAHIHRLVNKINAVILILQKCLQFPQQNGTVRKGIQVCKDLLIVPAFCSFAPEGHIEHLQHPLLYRRQGCKVGDIQFRQKPQQKTDPPAGIDDRKACKGFGHSFFQRLCKIGCRPCADAQSTEADLFAVNCTRVKMIVVEEVPQCQGQTGILGKGSRPRHKPGGAVIGGADIVQHILCGNFLQLNVAALRRRDKALFELPADAAGGVGEQCYEFLLKIILFVGLPDEIQNGQAILVFCQT